MDLPPKKAFLKLPVKFSSLLKNPNFTAFFCRFYPKIRLIFPPTRYIWNFLPPTPYFTTGLVYARRQEQIYTPTQRLFFPKNPKIFIPFYSQNFVRIFKISHFLSFPFFPTFLTPFHSKVSRWPVKVTYQHRSSLNWREDSRFISPKSILFLRRSHLFKSRYSE